MNQQLFALSLGFGGLILAAHHAFAEPAPGTAHPAPPVATAAR